jgi:type IV secretion system protein VirB10
MPENQSTRQDLPTGQVGLPTGQAGVPQVEDKRPKITGLIPKNAQTRFLGGIALLMIVIFSLLGKNPPKAPPAPHEPTATPTEASPARIREYRARIEEQQKKLAAEEAQLVQTKQALGLAAGQGTGLGPRPLSGERTYPNLAAQGYPPYSDQGRSPIESEKEKREYQSLFASNIALSLRAPASAAGFDVAASEAPRTNVVRRRAEPPAPGRAPTTAVAMAADSTPASRGASHGGDAGDLNRADGKEHRLFEGTVIETVLTNRLDASLSGPVNCLVATNVYSHDGQHVLIPQGTRVLGEVRKVESFGEQRLAVTFHRLIMPDGYSASLDKFLGLNQVGETGLRDQVNHHYLQIFGVSLAIGAIAGLAQTNTQYGFNASAGDAYRQGVASSLAQSSLHILDRYLNVLPTYTIREGHRVKIYLAQDLVLPAYEAHQMPSDL